MNISSNPSWWSLAVLLGFLSGCASLPISQSYQEEALKNVLFSTILQDPEKYVGKTVIWGGQIIEMNNTPNGSELIIMEMPLDNYDFPRSDVPSEGRFIAKTPNFLEPEIFQKGKLITLAGNIVGTETRDLGKMQYAYPVINIDEYYLWQNTTAPYYYYDPYYYYWPYDGFYGYGDWYWDGFPAPYIRKRFEPGPHFPRDHEHDGHSENREHHERHK